jgi:hypothetical protein
MLRGAGRVQGRLWTPLDLPSLGAWYSGPSLLPQSVAALTGWNDEGPNNYDLGTLSTPNVPAVIAAGSSFAGEFIRNATAANSEYVHGSGFTITAGASGGMWGVLALRSGADTAAFHTILAIGNPSSATRFVELDLHPSGGALYPGIFVRDAGTITSTRCTSASIADTNYHSVLIERDGAGATCKIWLDGTEITSLTTSGAQGLWFDDWTLGFLPTRIAIGVGIRGGTPAEGGDLKITDTGFYHGTLGGNLNNLLGHLARKAA